MHQPSTAPFAQQVVFLHAAALGPSVAFWEDIIGLPLVLDQGACRIYRVSADSFIGLCSHRGPPADPNSVIVTLVTDDVDAWHSRLVRKGIAFERPPTLNERFNIRHCLLRDPAGYLVEIQQFLDPAWPAPSGKEAA